MGVNFETLQNRSGPTLNTLANTHPKATAEQTKHRDFSDAQCQWIHSRGSTESSDDTDTTQPKENHAARLTSPHCSEMGLASTGGSSDHAAPAMPFKLHDADRGTREASLTSLVCMHDSNLGIRIIQSGRNANPLGKPFEDERRDGCAVAMNGECARVHVHQQTDSIAV